GPWECRGSRRGGGRDQKAVSACYRSGGTATVPRVAACAEDRGETPDGKWGPAWACRTPPDTAGTRGAVPPDASPERVGACQPPPAHPRAQRRAPAAASARDPLVQ